MAKQMPELAKIYLEEFALLQRAQEELAGQLNKMWPMLRDYVESDLGDAAKAHGQILHNLDSAPVKASPGDYWVRSENYPAKLHVRIRDPRVSDEAGKFTVELSFPQGAQAEMRKIPDAMTHFEQFAKGSDIDRLKWGTSYPWSVAIAINTDDLEETVMKIGDAILGLFKVIVQYEQWISNNANSDLMQRSAKPAFSPAVGDPAASSLSK